MIKAVVFDLDNTLYNFDAANESGILALAAYTEPLFGWDYAKMKALYGEFRKKLTERMGDVGAAHNRLIRFQNLLEEKKLPIHPHALQMAKSYWRGVLDNMAPAPGAREMMEELRNMGIRMGLGTDMTAYVQYEKLNRLGLLEYMDFIVSSEEAGIDKPGRAFFSLCVRKAGCLPGECLFIGDNVVRDYGGAAAAGMQARWFIPPWKQKNSDRISETSGTGQAGAGRAANDNVKPAAGLLTAADGLFPEEASKDLDPVFARALRDPGTPESRAVLDAVPRIHALSEVPGIVRGQGI